MIKNVHKWEKAVILLLNADGWDLTHTGKGFEHYDAIGTSPKGTEVVIEDEDAETNDNQLCFKKSEIWLSENKLKNLESEY